MNIGHAAKFTGVSSKMIRHYEAIGLISSSSRSEAGYRIYGESDLHKLRFVKRARSLGFSLDQIKQLLSLWRDEKRSSADVKALALSHAEVLTQKIRELTEMRDLIKELANRCHGDNLPDCPIIGTLSSAE